MTGYTVDEAPESCPAGVIPRQHPIGRPLRAANRWARDVFHNLWVPWPGRPDRWNAHIEAAQ